MRFRRMTLLSGLLVALAGGCGFCMAAEPSMDQPVLVEVRKIWDQAEHSAFTDLIRFKDRWFCTFREADSHVGGRDGRIRVITSAEGRDWASAALIAESGVDLRDPKLSITPDGRLMIVAGGSVYQERRLLGRQPRVCFSADGRDWTAPAPVCESGDWLWRVTWHEGVAWGVSYRAGAPEGEVLALMRSTDGLRYERVRPLDLTGRPNETTLRFRPDGTMLALVRREAESRHAMIGSSRPPYTEWTWHETAHQVGGPNFVILPDGRMWAAGRSYPGGARTVLAHLTPTAYEPVLTLPSGGDTSYPGLVWHEGLLWMSYYSSHEGKTCIYLARIRLPEGRD